MNLLKLTLSILTCSVISSTFAQADHYVKVGGAGSMDGTSWADAYDDLQLAINMATPGEEIWVATGTYTPSHDNPRSSDNTARDVTFYIDKNIKIYGGFDGNESFLSQRDLKNAAVVLSGDLGVAGSAYHVLYIDGSSNPIATSCLLDGFHIMDGSADGSVPDNVGGGIFIDGRGMGGQANPTIRNCIFQDNIAQSGGAIFNEGFNNGECSPILRNCLFMTNHATFGGGAIYNNGYGGENRSKYDNCTFSKNTAVANGPALFNDGRSSGICEPKMDNCIIWDNGVQDDIHNLEATTAISNSILDDGTPDAVISTPGVSVGARTLDEDPLFSDPTMSDFTLQLCSPAINRGGSSILTHDLCGNTRTFLSVVDMGAYENIQIQCPTPGQPIYVDQDVGVCIGTTWANAHADLQNAINLACHCPGEQDIWVAEGTYVPTQDNPSSSENGIRDRTFFMDKPIRIYGGFAGTESSLNQRNINLHPTILSGALTATDSAFHVMYMEADTIDNNWEVDGFTVEHGRAEGALFKNIFGGGLYASSPSSGLDYIAPLITNCIIRNNRASNFGGGFYFRALGSSSTLAPAINNCEFSNNEASSGGGVAMEARNGTSTKIAAQISDCNFIGNQAISNGGGIYSSAEDEDATIIQRCTIRNNIARFDGAGLYFFSLEGSYTHPIITSTLFRFNESTLDDGGGLHIASDTCNLELLNCHFQSNVAASLGGGVSLNYSTGKSSIYNCLFAKNTAPRGAGLDVGSHPDFDVVAARGIELVNCTFASNTTMNSTAGIFISSDSSALFANCIFWGNVQPSGPSDIQISPAMGEMINSLHSPNGLDGNFLVQDTLQKDPLFMDTMMLDFRLLTGSPAINIGLDSLVKSVVDLEDKTRILGPKVDMGAYESGDPCSEKNTFLHPNFFTADQVLAFVTDDCILGTNKILAGADITYDADGGILLDSLFSVEQGATFIAKTDGCP